MALSQTKDAPLTAKQIGDILRNSSPDNTRGIQVAMFSTALINLCTFPEHMTYAKEASVLISILEFSNTSRKALATEIIPERAAREGRNYSVDPLNRCKPTEIKARLAVMLLLDDPALASKSINAFFQAGGHGAGSVYNTAWHKIRDAEGATKELSAMRR